MRKKRISRFVLPILLCAALSGCSALKNLARSVGESNERYEKRVMNETADAFFTALDARDKAAIFELFAPNLKEEESGLDDQIELLLEAYTSPTDIYKCAESSISGSYSNSHGTKSAELDVSFPVVSGNKNYWCNLTLRYQDDEHPEEVGVQCITLYTAEYLYAMRNGDAEKHTLDSRGLYVYTDANIDYEVRFIGGYPRKFTPIDRTITVAQAETFFQSQSTYSALLKQFGAPNFASPEDGWLAYELTPENGEPRYMDVTLKHQSDEIYCAYITNDLDIVAVATLWKASSTAGSDG